MSTPQLVLTITLDGRLLVSARAADGAVSPTRTIAVDQDNRLAGFVADMQELARRQLAPLKPSAIGRTNDSDPTAANVAHGEQGQSNA